MQVCSANTRGGERKREEGNANAGNEIPLDVLVLYAY